MAKFHGAEPIELELAVEIATAPDLVKRDGTSAESPNLFVAPLLWLLLLLSGFWNENRIEFAKWRT